MKHYLKSFPSPLGELYFLMSKGVSEEPRKSHVSVPSRGAIFLNNEHRKSDLITQRVSAPW